ncbi:hypothetical protein Tco_1041960 [Tanacetum coccineum]|uniref:Uncharacterized protein n=1 Tax=Tanacetum coccineum TaxID=301880 RepID=A0ABQ5GI67_9ASTR
MGIPDQTAVSKHKLKIVSSSIHVDDADHGGLVKKLRSYKKSSKANEVLQPSRAPNTKSSVRRLPKEKGPVKPKAAPLKPKPAVKPKAAPLKPKPAVKQSVGKRNRSVDDVVSDVINDLNDSKVVKRNENVLSDERGDGDQDQDSNKDVESNKDEVSNGAEESDKDDEANQTEEESNNDEESNKDEEINEAEESDQQLVNNLITKTVKRKTATKGKKKDVASGKKKDVIYKSNSESEAKMVKKRSKKTKVALKSKKREPVFEDKVLKVKKNLKKKKKQVFDSSSSFEDEKPIMKKKKLDAKKKKKKPMTLTQIEKEKYLRGFPPLRSRTVPCSLFSAIRDSQVNMKSFLSDIGFSSLHNVFIDTLPSRFSRPLDDDFMKMWFNQFDPKPLKDIHATDISKKLVLSKKVDFMFKVNFLMLFANVMGMADTMKAIVNLTVLRRIREDTNIAEIDWCSFIHSCLKQSEVPNTLNGFYIGPLTFLIDLKIMDEVIGRLELHRPWSESELHETGSFYELCDVEKAELEDILRKANTQFPNDVGVFVLYEKYVGVFKDTVLLEDEHEDLFVWPSKVPVDVHRPKTAKGRVTCSSKKRISKPSAYLSSPYMNKKTVVIAQVKRLEFVLGNSCSADCRAILSMIILDNSECGETYTSKYKDACELLKRFFSRYLSENNHPLHEKVAKVKARIPKLKWSTTKNHVDYGVFLMIHMGSYIGEPAARWNVGLCAESHTHDSLLRRMRYQIDAKILLQELNIYSQKMFDLAYKFETENDKHSRISIIVNAIKNRAERDPTKNVVENEEGDAVKNIKGLSGFEGFSRGGDMNRLCVAEKNVMGTWQFCPLKLYSVVAWEVPKALTVLRCKGILHRELPLEWNVGLCTESHMQDSLLRRMRYKIAAKILLHELNIHSQKMFDLAYKFETENDEHVKNFNNSEMQSRKVERDPIRIC